MDDFLQKFKHKFIEEANELLNRLQNEMLELEKKPRDLDLLQSTFRCLHNIKGAAGMYGFNYIQDLVHHLETIFDLLRTGKLLLSEDIVTLTLHSADTIKYLLSDEILATESARVSYAANLRDVRLLANVSAEGESDFVAPQELSASVKSYYIRFHLSEKLLKRGISVVNLFRDLGNIGDFEIVRNFPDESDKLEDESYWAIYLVSEADIQQIEEVFVFVQDHILIRYLSDFDILSDPEFKQQLVSLQRAKQQVEIKSAHNSIQQVVEEHYNTHTTISADQTAVSDEKVVKIKDISTDLQKGMEGSRKAPKLEFLPSFEKEIEQKQRISVDSQKLDQLMHLVTELVTTQSQFSLAMHTEDLHTLNDVMGRMQKLTKQFRDITIDIRLVPLSELAVVFKRLVRDLSKQLSKKVNFVTEGVDTELDKSTLQLLTEPLMHIIRNCIDHGINTPEMRQSKGKAPEGTITFKAWQLGNDIFIKISDDGEGLDLERIAEKAIAQKLISANTKLTHELAAELIFHPGFSTAESITEVSGRGVGMDVVRRKLQEIRGQVVVQSQTGVGSSFTLKLQQSIAILDTMLVRVAGIHCLIPLTDIEVCGQTNYPELLENKYLHTIEFGGEAIPYVILRDKLQLLDNLPTKAKVVYLSVEAKRIGLVVDQIIGEHQAVLKPLGKEFETIQYINSASTLGDGSLAYLLNITQLFAGYRSKLD